VLRVVGLASSIPYKGDVPNDPMNRRISIVVMNKKTENQVLHDGAEDKPGSSDTSVPGLPAISPTIQQNTKITGADGAAH